MRKRCRSPAAADTTHVVLVTGASGSIGQAICAAITREQGQPLRSDFIGRGEVDLPLDVTNEPAWILAAHEIERQYGRLDGLVNNAGIVFVGTVEATSLAQWRRVMDVNVDGVFLGCRHMLPLLRRAPAPSIVNISSVSGLVVVTISRPTTPPRARCGC
jgi:NAD(P)-dependent dehydrogenase (short-subunit alcohol dehydrogenase family)